MRLRGFFAKLTDERLRRGVFTEVVDLQAAINRFLERRSNVQTVRLDRRSECHYQKVTRERAALASVG